MGSEHPGIDHWDTQQQVSPMTSSIRIPADLQHVMTEVREGILTITLNRPAKRNAMSVELTFEMVRLLEAVALEPSIRVVVLRGAGDGFCAGMDIGDFFDSSKRDDATLIAAKEAANHWRVRLLRNLPQPTIAMVHGFCFGGAFGIVEACDIAIAADDTKFTLSEINFGHFPAGPVAKAISRTMTARAASYYSLTGYTFDAAEAQRVGFVTRSVPSARLEDETYALAAHIAGKDRIALQFTKESLQHVESMTWDAALNYNTAKFAELKARQQGDTSRAASVASFLEGKSRPGLGG